MLYRVLHYEKYTLHQAIKQMLTFLVYKSICISKKKKKLAIAVLLNNLLQPLYANYLQVISDVSISKSTVSG